MTSLSVENLGFSRGKIQILEEVSFTIDSGKSVALLGKSGCGKTTILRLIAGLEKMQEGVIKLDGNIIADATHHKPSQSRSMGMVFQAPSLFPHLTVAENIAFGVKNLKKKERDELVKRYAEKVGMEDHLLSYSDEISGGQQQRVALARALICKPSLMLLDEPFSSLDKEAREQLRVDVKQLLQEENVTSILVTHDEEEAIFFASQILRIHDKKCV